MSIEKDIVDAAQAAVALQMARVADEAAKQFARPSILLRPKLCKVTRHVFTNLVVEQVFEGIEEGWIRKYNDSTGVDCWLAVYDDVRAFGMTPSLALEEFDWLCGRQRGFERG